MIVMPARSATLRFAISGVIAAGLLAGCSTSGGAPRAENAVGRAEAALAKGDAAKAIPLAEAAVAASPRAADLRAMLGHAYFKAGRFDSAATTFNDAMELGDNSARTALSLALSYAATGRNDEALSILDDWRDSIPAGDLGLALALAGDAGRGVAILSDAIRSGENTPKVRQNLAYAYALDGRWREARLMTEQDVPADQVDERLGLWAQTARPEAAQQRVATLLRAPLRSDPGQPARLALANTPSAEQLAAESGALRPQPKPAPVGELPAVEEQAPAAPAQPAMALAAYAPSDAPASAVAKPVVQPVENRVSVSQAFAGMIAPQQAAPAHVARTGGAAAATGSHLVQLGSFSSLQGARRAWGILAARNPELRNYRMAITPAVVRGKNFWRVAAAGLNAGGAGGLCSTVKARGGACFAYVAVPARATNPASPRRDATGPLRARRR